MLAVWGIGSGPYWMIPLLGPSNPRDTVGYIVDGFLNLTPSYAAPVAWVNGRAIAVPTVDRAREASLDYYLFVRDAYLQRREAQIDERGPMRRLDGAEPEDEASRTDDFYEVEECETGCQRAPEEQVGESRWPEGDRRRGARGAPGRPRAGAGARRAATDDATAVVQHAPSTRCSPCCATRRSPPRSAQQRRSSRSPTATSTSTRSRASSWRGTGRSSRRSSRRTFVVEFKRHLSRHLLEDPRGLPRPEGRRSTAPAPRRTATSRCAASIEGERSEPIRIDYRMRPTAGEWVVIDVIIEGVSLVQNFRSQTQEIIGEVGVDGLIERLREKNAERKKGVG